MLFILSIVFITVYNSDFFSFLFGSLSLWLVSWKYVHVCAKSHQSCLTLCNSMDCSSLGFSLHGILQARYWSGLPFPTQGIFPIQGLNPHLLCLLHRQVGFLTTNATWEAQGVYPYCLQYNYSGPHSTWLMSNYMNDSTLWSSIIPFTKHKATRKLHEHHTQLTNSEMIKCILFGQRLFNFFP